jgi:hypothetical protein
MKIKCGSSAKFWGYAYIWKLKDVWFLANGNYTHRKVT